MKKWLIFSVVVIAVGVCIGIVLVPKSETAPPIEKLITVTAEGYVTYQCEGAAYPSDENTEVRLFPPSGPYASTSTGPGGWYSVSKSGGPGTWTLQAFYNDGSCTCESDLYTKYIDTTPYTWEQDIEFPYCRCGCHP